MMRALNARAKIMAEFQVKPFWRNVQNLGIRNDAQNNLFRCVSWSSPRR